MWPGTTPPRQGPKRRRARGIGASSALIERIAIREGIAPARKPKGEITPACVPHAFEILGYSSPYACVLALDDIARRRRPRRPRRALPPLGPRPKKKLRPAEWVEPMTLPRWKCPRGYSRVVALRCARRCVGGACDRCDGWGWGFRFYRREGAKTCGGTHT